MSRQQKLSPAKPQPPKSNDLTKWFLDANSSGYLETQYPSVIASIIASSTPNFLGDLGSNPKLIGKFMRTHEQTHNQRHKEVFDVSKFYSDLEQHYEINHKPKKGISLEFIDVLYIIVFGCALSTDIDVAVFVNPARVENGIIPTLSEECLENIHAKLNTHENYIGRDVDIVVLSVDETGSIIGKSKGGDEIGRIINATYANHVQFDAIPLIKEEAVNIQDKLYAITMFILNYLENFAIDYKVSKPRKKIICDYPDQDARIKAIANLDFLLDNVDLENNTKKTETDRVQWINDMKSLVMKICQLILLAPPVQRDKQYEYNKLLLAKKVGSMFPPTEYENLEADLLWFLTRGKITTEGHTLPTNPKKTLIFLYEKFSQIVDAHFTKMNECIKKITVPHSRCTEIMKQMTTSLEPDIHGLFLCALDEFLKSPNEYKDGSHFCIEWKKFEEAYKKTQQTDQTDQTDQSDISLNQLFASAFPTEPPRLEIKAVFDILIREHPNYPAVSLPWETTPRSKEWTKIREQYPGGKNSGSIRKGPEGAHNLIRGAIAEMLINKMINTGLLGDTIPIYKEYKLALPPIIINDDPRNKSSSSPDFAIVKTQEDHTHAQEDHAQEDQVIIGEIKSLKKLLHNSDYYRDLELAIKQCANATSILKINPKNHIVILSCFDEQNDLCMEIHLVSGK